MATSFTSSRTARSVRLRRFAVGMAAALAMLGAVAGPALAATSTTTITGTVKPGALTASVAVQTALPDVNYSTSSQTTSGVLRLNVDDSSGSDNNNTGWNVTVVASTFACSCGFASEDIAASNFALTTVATPVRIKGQAVQASPNGPYAITPGALTLDSARKVVSAAAKFGNGIYTQDLGVQLTVPASARPATYTSTITITYTAAP